jgi:hypothetical protein
MFCVHDCHKVDPSELATSVGDKFALPIVPHELVGGEDCCGCLIVVERDGQADLTCNECSAVVRTVPIADVERQLLQIAMSGGIASARCQHCGALQTFPGFDSIDAFVCTECGEGNSVRASVQ